MDEEIWCRSHTAHQQDRKGNDCLLTIDVPNGVLKGCWADLFIYRFIKMLTADAFWQNVYGADIMSISFFFPISTVERLLQK